MVNTKAFHSLSYGLYIVTAQSDGVKAGCVCNTFAQVTSTPPQASVALNKEHVTTDTLLKAGIFEVSVLAADAPIELIGRFGFKSSLEADKYAETDMELDEAGIAFVKEHAVAHFCVKVKEALDLGTHMLILGDVLECDVLSQGDPLTYAQYHANKGAKKTTPAPAPVQEKPAEGDEKKAPRYGWRCTVCGYIAEVDELPDDFVCPVCGLGKEVFERIEL